MNEGRAAFDASAVLAHTRSQQLRQTVGTLFGLVVVGTASA